MITDALHKFISITKKVRFKPRFKMVPVHTINIWLCAQLLTCLILLGQDPPRADLVAKLTGSYGQKRAQILAQLTQDLRMDAPALALSYGQEALTLLEKYPDPDLEVTVYNEMAWALMVQGEYVKANELATKGRDMAMAQGNLSGLGRAISNLGVITRRQGDILKAVDLFEQSLFWYRKADDKPRQAMSLNNLGFIHTDDFANYEQAQIYLSESIKLFKESGDEAGLSLCLNNIGTVYQELGDFQAAIENFNESLLIRKKLGIRHRIADSFVSIGVLHMRMANPKEALKNFQEAATILHQVGQTYSDTVLHLEMARAYLALEEFPSALKYFSSGISLADKFDADELKVDGLLGRANLYQKLGSYRDAEVDLLQAKAISAPLSQKKYLSQSCQQLAATFESSGNLKDALDQYKHYLSLNEESNRSLGARRYALITSQLEREKSKSDLEKLEKNQALLALKLSRQRTTWAWSGTAFSLVLIFGFFAYCKKVTISRLAEELSLTDPLTGLKNRRFLNQTMDHDLAEIVRRNFELPPGAVVQEANDLVFFMLDLDHFKQINDRYGHLAGDQVLVRMAKLLFQTCRTSDLVVRWGGEEFLIITRFCNRHSANVLAERLRTTIANHAFEIGPGITLKITCSIGFAPFPYYLDALDKLSWENVVNLADHAMYAAKKSGRNAWVGLFPNQNAPEAARTHEQNLIPKPQINAGNWLVEASLESGSLVWQ